MRIWALTVALLLSSCSSAGEDRTIVASLYPLAFAAERLAHPGWKVIDLTPPGIEAHDLELTLEQRSQIEDADMVFYLGQIGFQPQIERAIEEAEGVVIDLREALLPEDGPPDPHIWLEPWAFGRVEILMQQAICSSEYPCTPQEIAPQKRFRRQLNKLRGAYMTLLRCRYDTMIVPHEAFGYFEREYRLRQVGLAGPSPEAEPSADRLAAARQAIEDGSAGALFYEARGEDPEADRALAADLGVPAFPLETLESAPPTGDYFTVLQDNLESLREGLECQ